MTEQWRDVVGYEGIYSVSDEGRVRSEERVIEVAGAGRAGPWRRVKARIMKQHADPRGQMHLGLHFDGIQEMVVVQRLVLAAFVGPCPPGMESQHRDGNLANNTLANLRYVTRRDNAANCIRNGNHQNVNQTHCPHGHEYTPENTLVSGGRRKCRICQRKRDRRNGCHAADCDRRAQLKGLCAAHFKEKHGITVHAARKRGGDPSQVKVKETHDN
jgi:hypothetical protein